MLKQKSCIFRRKRWHFHKESRAEPMCKSLTMTDKLADETIRVCSRDLRFNIATQSVHPLRQLDGYPPMLGQTQDRLSFRFLPTPAGQTNTDRFRLNTFKRGRRGLHIARKVKLFSDQSD